MTTMAMMTMMTMMVRISNYFGQASWSGDAISMSINARLCCRRLYNFGGTWRYAVFALQWALQRVIPGNLSRCFEVEKLDRLLGSSGFGSIQGSPSAIHLCTNNDYTIFRLCFAHNHSIELISQLSIIVMLVKQITKL